MHIPENYLSPSTCGVFGIAMVPIWAHAITVVKRTVPRDKMPLLGVAAAFCFLAMMFNVPLPGGTTGHAVCGTLVAVLFGPWAACIAVSIALIIQAVFFGDGGILAIGANCFNMAFVLPMVGYGIYSLVKPHAKGFGGELVAAGVGAYVGINCAALCAAIEFGVQPLLFTDGSGQALFCPYPLWVSVPAMIDRPSDGLRCGRSRLHGGHFGVRAQDGAVVRPAADERCLEGEQSFRIGVRADGRAGCGNPAGLACPG